MFTVSVAAATIPPSQDDVTANPAHQFNDGVNDTSGDDWQLGQTTDVAVSQTQQSANMRTRLTAAEQLVTSLVAKLRQQPNEVLLHVQECTPNVDTVRLSIWMSGCLSDVSVL